MYSEYLFICTHKDFVLTSEADIGTLKCWRGPKDATTETIYAHPVKKVKKAF